MDILKEGYHATIRAMLGVDELDLPDSEIDNSKAPAKAEMVVKKAVTDWATLTDDFDLFNLEDSALNYVCYLLCPSMARRINIEVKSLDAGWKKDKTNWSELANDFLFKFSENLVELGVVAYTPVLTGIIQREYDPI